MSTINTTKGPQQIPITSTYTNIPSRPRPHHPQSYQKIHLTDLQHTPRLAHVNIHLSSINKQHHQNSHLPVTALHDSGCAKSVIKTSIFNDLLKHGHISIIPPPNKTVVVTVTGAMEPVEGTADIMLHFQGLNKSKMSYPLNVVIHPSITQDFLLGRDFTGSDAKAAETNDFLYLTQDFNTYWDKLSNLKNNPSLCNVPLINTQNSTFNVALSHTTVLAPFSVTNLPGCIPKTANKRIPTLQPTYTFETTDSKHPSLQILPILSTFQSIHRMTIPMYNNSHQDLILPKGTPIATISIINQTQDLHSCDLQISDLHKTSRIELNAMMTGLTDEQTSTEKHPTSERPYFINDDPAMSEDEKEEAFMDYIKHGYHHPSMTKEVEEKSALTELYLKSTIPIPDHLFHQQFDAHHLPQKHQKQAKHIFTKNKEAFSRHACDLGKSNALEMTIPLTTS